MWFLPMSIRQNAQKGDENVGGGDYVTKHRNIYTRQQAVRMGLVSDDSNITRIVTGGMERITYKEKVNGVTVIRTKWRQKKKKERRKRS